VVAVAVVTIALISFAVSEGKESVIDFKWALWACVLFVVGRVAVLTDPRIKKYF
jgi:hypothetical protein